MTRVVFVDTETTGLDPACEQVFEIAAVTDTREHVWRIHPTSDVLARMHPAAAKVNRYHDRVSEAGWVWSNPYRSLRDLGALLDGAYLAGAVPSFDAAHLTATFLRFGIAPPRWQHRLVCVETMAAGVLGLDAPVSLSESARLLGVPVDRAVQHTALYDAFLARDVYDAARGRARGWVAA